MANGQPEEQTGRFSLDARQPPAPPSEPEGTSPLPGPEDAAAGEGNGGLDEEIAALLASVKEIQPPPPEETEQELPGENPGLPSSTGNGEEEEAGMALEPQAEEADTQPFLPGEGTPAVKKERRDFNLNLEKELKKIPDYRRGDPRYKKKRKKRKLTAFAKIMMAVIILGLSVSLSFVILTAAQDMFGMNKPDEEIIISVPQNATVTDVAEQLETTGVIRSAYLFRLYYRVVDPSGSIQYGTYKLNSNMSYDAIIGELSKYSTSRDEVTVMFPEGSTLYDMALALQKENVCDVDVFLEAVDQTNFGYDFETQLPEDPNRFHRLEGYAFPDTYNFYVEDNPIDVANKLLKNFSNKWTEERETKRKASGLTLDQVITIASIVQKESGNPEEMKRVASVYLNRLNSRETYPKLEADPTRKYSEQLRLQMKGIVDQEVLDAYNTYEGAGLPPGPICNPGLDAIDAVLNPEQTDYYFFCNNLETGEYFYATTLQEHEQNLRKAGLA